MQYLHAVLRTLVLIFISSNIIRITVPGCLPDQAFMASCAISVVTDIMYMIRDWRDKYYNNSAGQ